MCALLLVCFVLIAIVACLLFASCSLLIADSFTRFAIYYICTVCVLCVRVASVLYIRTSDYSKQEGIPTKPEVFFEIFIVQ